MATGAPEDDPTIVRFLDDTNMQIVKFGYVAPARGSFEAYTREQLEDAVILGEVSLSSLEDSIVASIADLRRRATGETGSRRVEISKLITSQIVMAVTRGPHDNAFELGWRAAAEPASASSAPDPPVAEAASPVIQEAVVFEPIDARKGVPPEALVDYPGTPQGYYARKMGAYSAPPRMATRYRAVSNP
jgi:hypothetical protein